MRSHTVDVSLRNLILPLRLHVFSKQKQDSQKGSLPEKLTKEITQTKEIRLSGEFCSKIKIRIIFSEYF